MTTVSVYAPGSADVMDSYGLIATQLARHLTRQGAYVNLLPMGERQMDSHDPELAAIAAQPVRPSLGGVVLGYPSNYHRHPSPLLPLGPRVALTMFESSKIPAGWADVLNTCAAVITPSTFCRDVFRDCGVTAPVHVVPLGVGDAYVPVERTEGRPFTFLTFIDRGKRKGGLHAVQAFLRAFGDSMDYRLILKSRDPRVGMILDNPNIEVIQRDMSEAELAALFGRCDALVMPSLGEGFGLIPREFSSTGGIALATDWSGTADDIDLWGVPLPYRLVKADWTGARNLQGQELGEWAEPDVDGVAAIMRNVAAEREWYAYRAMQTAPRVRQLYSWEMFAARVLDIWEEVTVGDGITTLQAA